MLLVIRFHGDDAIPRRLAEYAKYIAARCLGETRFLLGDFRRPKFARCGFTLLCTNAGFSPRVINEPARMRTVLMTVAAGIGVSLSATCFRSFHQLVFGPRKSLKRQRLPPRQWVAIHLAYSSIRRGNR